MKLRCVPYSVSLAHAEDRALRRLRVALDLRTPADVMRALIRAAHAEVCPQGELDADLQAAQGERDARALGATQARELRATRGRKRVKLVVRECRRQRCRTEFEVPVHNRGQKFCCRTCYDKWRAAGAV